MYDHLCWTPGNEEDEDDEALDYPLQRRPLHPRAVASSRSAHDGKERRLCQPQSRGSKLELLSTMTTKAYKALSLLCERRLLILQSRSTVQHARLLVSPGIHAAGCIMLACGFASLIDRVQQLCWLACARLHSSQPGVKPHFLRKTRCNTSEPAYTWSCRYHQILHSGRTDSYSNTRQQLESTRLDFIVLHSTWLY